MLNSLPKDIEIVIEVGMNQEPPTPMGSNEPLTTLTDKELAEVEEYLKIVLGLSA